MIRQLMALTMLLCFAAPQAAAETLFYTHSLGNSVEKGSDGGLTGKPEGGNRAYYVELVKAMMQQAGDIRPIHEVPLNRGLALLERGGPVSFFKIVRTYERNPKFKWVGPISNFKTWFYEHEFHPTGIKTMDDARAVKAVCAVRGDNMVKWFADHRFKNIVQASTYEDCVQLLEYGRVNLIYGSRYRPITQDRERAGKIHRTQVSTADENYQPDWGNYGYIAFSMAVPDAEIAKWQAALDALATSGELEKLKQTYLVDVNGPPLEAGLATSH